MREHPSLERMPFGSCLTLSRLRAASTSPAAHRASASPASGRGEAHHFICDGMNAVSTASRSNAGGNSP